MIKNMGKRGKEILLEIINKAWTGVDIPRQWEVALKIPISKKGKDVYKRQGPKEICGRNGKHKR